MSLSTYRASIRSVIRAVWSGVFSATDGVLAMRPAIERGIRDAWRAGGAECNIKPGEFTFDELAVRDRFIDNQISFVPQFITWVEQNSKANGGKLKDVFSGGGRLEMWVNRWNEAKTQASAMVCTDVKKQWILGPTEEHCLSCGTFADRVYRNSVWQRHGALPQVKKLCCSGFNCLCILETTQDRITPGRFPVGALC